MQDSTGREITFYIEIVSPDRTLYSDQAKEAYFPGTDGDFGVLPNHCSLVSSLRIGEIRVIKEDDTNMSITINTGFVKIGDNKVSVLVEDAVADYELSLDEILARKIATQDQLSHTSKEDATTFHMLEVALQRALVDEIVAKNLH